MKLVPFKTWLTYEAEKNGLTYCGAFDRYQTGTITPPPMHRKNRRVILVEVPDDSPLTAPAPAVRSRVCECGNVATVKGKWNTPICERCERIERSYVHNEDSRYGRMFRGDDFNPKPLNQND